MRPTECESGLLRALASMPFLDRLEMVAVTGWSRSEVYEAVRGLEDREAVTHIPHAADLIPPTLRYRLTGDGLRELAEIEGAAVDELLRSRPVSVEWLRLLMERLDSLAVIYRLASGVSNVAYPASLRLYRARPIDASLRLRNGRTIAVVRQGHASDRTGFSKRLWKLGDGPLPDLVLLLAPDEVRLRHSRSVLRGTRVNALLALERDAALAGAADRIWRPVAPGAPIDLRYALDRLGPGGELPVEAPLSKATMPGGSARDAGHALPAILKPAEKRALDLIFDWPWIARKDMASLLAVSEQRASELTIPLEGFGLVTGLPAGRGRRLALTDRGLALLARRDRASVGVARRRWSIAPVDGDAPLDWRNVSGGRSRQLLRNIEHTEAVHAFAAALGHQSRALGWELVQLDPPRRASRHFRLGGSLRSVHPDAFGALRRGPATWLFFLEWERRAVRPATMSERLAPYLRYYSTHRPADDHGVLPDVLVVFETTSRQPTSSEWRANGCGRRGWPFPCGSPTGKPSTLWGRWDGPGAPRASGNPPRSCRACRAHGAVPTQILGRTGTERRLPSCPERRSFNTMESDRNDELRGRRRSGGRAVVRLNTQALWARLALLNRSQNWLAEQTGISSSYLSKLVTQGRAPSGRIRLRMLKALDVENFHELFRLEEEDHNGKP